MILLSSTFLGVPIMKFLRNSRQCNCLIFFISYIINHYNCNQMNGDINSNHQAGNNEQFFHDAKIRGLEQLIKENWKNIF